MERIILHSDLNNFFASVECRDREDLKDRAVIICGDPKQRRGIVVAKNEIAKKAGIKTGDTVWQAEKKCLDLVAIAPNLHKYREVSGEVRRIYYRYTDQVEPYGLDEAWLDVTGSIRLFGGGHTIADAIRADIKRELGLTVSVGVSFNKVFAKLGSDMKKPDAVTVISPENYKEKVWPLPVGELLYVGRATRKKLLSYGITTIGALAHADPSFLETAFGKHGHVLWEYANGYDHSPVSGFGERESIKSIGNSMTLMRDITEPEEVRHVLYILAESVCERLRAQKLSCGTVTLAIRDSMLIWHERQKSVTEGTTLAIQVAEAAFKLFMETKMIYSPVHSLGVRVGKLSVDYGNTQLDMFEDAQIQEKYRVLEKTMDEIRKKHGHLAISRAMLLGNHSMYRVNLKDDQIVSFPGCDREE